MAYRPLHAQRFGPSTRSCLIAYGYAALTAVFAAFVGYAHVAPHGSWAHGVLLDHASSGVPPAWFALAALASGLAAMMQAHMRGVLLHPDGIETFEFAALGFPRVRRFDWPVIDRLRFDTRSTITLDLWDGSHAFLPVVGDREALTRALAYVAMARAIPFTGDPGEIELPEG
jgi:hypothetical protein